MTFCPGVPIVLVGCKKDLRNDPNYRNWRGESLVTLEQVRPCLIHTLQNCDSTHLTLSINFCALHDRTHWLIYSQGQEVADKIGAHSFHECSALTNESVNEVLEGVARAAIINVEPNNTGTRKQTLNPFVFRWKLGQRI